MKISAAKCTLVLASIYQKSDPAVIQQQALARLYLQAPKQPAPGIEMAINHHLKKRHVKIYLAASSLPSPSFQPGDAELCLWKRTAPALVGMLLPAGLELDGGQGSLPRPCGGFSSLSGQVSKAKNKSMTVCGKGRGQQQ